MSDSIVLSISEYEELSRAAEMGDTLRALIADDAYSASFQSFGQYRSALLRECQKG